MKKMATYGNLIPVGNSSSNGNFTVNGSSGESAILVDKDLNTIIKKLVLVDEKTGNKWEVKISDGELIAEPLELEDKREYKLKKLLKND